MRVGGVVALGIVAIVAVMAGCVQWTTVDGGVVVHGVTYPVPIRTATNGSDGYVVIHVESPLNTSYFLNADHVAERTRFAPIDFTVFHGNEPAYVFSMQDDSSVESTYVGAGSLEYEAPGPRTRPEQTGFIGEFFHDAKESTIVITWANAESSARIDLFFLPGSEPRLMAQGSAISAAAAKDMDGGHLRWGTGQSSGSVDAEWSAGSAGSTTLSVINLDIAGDVEIVIRDEADERRASYAGTGDGLQDGLFVVATGPGETLYRARGASAGQMELSIRSASLPKGLLPEGIFAELNRPPSIAPRAHPTGALTSTVTGAGGTGAVDASTTSAQGVTLSR